MPSAPTPVRRPLLQLLRDANVEFTCTRPLDSVWIASLSDDSRRVEKESLFVAVDGTVDDGHRFIAQAVDSGAGAVVLSDPSRIDERVPNIVVANTWQTLARLAATHSGLATLQANGNLHVIAVTGTNGKSTTGHLIRNVLREAGHSTALLGTIEYDLVGRQLDAPWTTPPPIQLAQFLVEAHRHGARYAVMEVSSHALDQHRTDGVVFEAAVFTNLSGDHLDYHENSDNYFRAKKRLFDNLPTVSHAVINADDVRSREIVSDCDARVVRFGIEQPADVRAAAIRSDIHGSRFALNLAGNQGAVCLPLIGRHNISNALAAAATAMALGIDPETVRRALDGARTIPGRLQRAEPTGKPFSVFVDYAHTDDALENVLTALRPLTRGKLWCVFGCGGDRDRSKRPRMASVAARHADRVVVTSDNPRTEDPMAIINDVLTGFDGNLKRVTIEKDRLRAIHATLQNAERNDVVLIAGKGHENYQIVGTERLHFDDIETVEAFFAAPATAAAAEGCAPLKL